jgi:phospholipid/cholesterol/gamma-HCH transport system permease protein
MSTVGRGTNRVVLGIGDLTCRAVATLGDFSIFSAHTLGWVVRRPPVRGSLLSSLYMVGVRSVPVVAITGTFIGMVLAVQSYTQFHNLGLDTRLGSLINISIVRELGPVLAATMIAGRVGSAMAAELGTMRITEQVDALACLGFNPLHFLIVPRYLACVLLIPLLAVLADFMGIMGGALICTKVYGVEAHYYWLHAQAYVSAWDVLNGLIKSVFFGAAIALISCHRGLRCDAGAEGVGRAATEAFVASFIAILVIDFFLAVFLSSLHDLWWSTQGARLF